MGGVGIAGADGYPAIDDYAIVGDSRTAALISRDGSVDWLCLPRLDSPAIFCALLDRQRGGRFLVRPAGGSRVRHAYIQDTNVLETIHDTGGGRLRVVDLMTVGSEETKQRRLHPDQQLLRAIYCEAGEVEVELLYDPRLDYGSRVPRLDEHRHFGWFFHRNAHVFGFRTDLPVRPRGTEPGLAARETLRAGERRFATLFFGLGDPVVVPPLGDHAEARVEEAVDWWSRWASQLEYDGDYRDAVLRSALVLKLLTYAPSGAVVAAPTTSLPEWIGGQRNWDYRYTWLRDASLTVASIFDLGYHDEARAFMDWMSQATVMTRPRLQVLYDLFGDPAVPERQLDHLEGYRGSRPVRVGNHAHRQTQLDVYGQVIAAAHEFVERGEWLRKEQTAMVSELAGAVLDGWEQPDSGIWEVRSPPRHHTYSKVMCCVALDRLLKMQRQGHIDLDPAPLRRARDTIHDVVERRGWNEALGSYVTSFGGEDVDASLLLLGIYGYADPRGERMRSTYRLLRQRLERDGMFYRYRFDDGLNQPEGAFGIASFWAVMHEALAGDSDAAHARFERLLALGNDVGLFSEEWDPGSGASLGNFPQAYTHVGLIEAALALAEDERGIAFEASLRHRRRKGEDVP